MNASWWRYVVRFSLTGEFQTLMGLTRAEHPHGLSDLDYDSIFTRDKHIIFGFHGYPWLIHRLTYRRTNQNLHVRGYKEEGTITTPFDLRVQSGLDRFHLVQHVIDRPLTWCEGELPEADHAGQAHRAQAVRRHLRLGHAGDPGLEVGRRTVSETEKR